jgi:AraC-like DNA-binding protein
MLLALHRHVASTGRDADALFAEVGIDARLFLQPGARVRSDIVNRMWRHAEAALGDDCIGLASAKYCHPSVADALGYAWLASFTLRDAMRRLSRYMRIFAGIARVKLHELPDGDAELLLEPVTLPSARHDSFIASIVSFCRANRGESFKPMWVDLARPAPKDRSRHDAHFGCPVRFNAPATLMHVAAADLDARLPTANAEIAAMTERMLESQLAKLDRQDVVAQLKTRILDALPSGSPTEEDIARMLAMSQRTLQRRLASAGTSFGDVLDTTRRDLAFHHLANPDRQISEIAYLLGFAEAASFNRAFRRWAGQTPSEYRASLAAAPAAA